MKKIQKRQLKRWSIMYSICLLCCSVGLGLFNSTVLATASSGAEGAENHYQQLTQELNKQLAEADIIDQKEFMEQAKAQLEARGLVANEDGEVALAQQEIRIIVDLEEDAAVEETALPTGSKKSIKAIEEAAEQVIVGQVNIQKQVEKLTGNQVHRNFGYLVNGFSIDASYQAISQIQALAGVKSVSLAQVYTPSVTEESQLVQSQKILQQQSELKGDGMVVSIIDTGIDPAHQDLRLSSETKEKLSLNQGQASADTIGYGAAFNRKIPFGYNYADNNAEIVDKNPATNMHGMHVAGIVAANGEGADPTQSVVGVAPEAQLLAMKVFSNNTKIATALDDDILAAIEDSVKLGADIINISLGSVAGTADPAAPVQAAIREAAEAGILSVVAAGNNSLSTTNNTSVDPQNKFGINDTGTLSSPGVTAEALTVASTENSVITSSGMLVKTVDGDGGKSLQPMTSSSSVAGAVPITKLASFDVAPLNQGHALVAVGSGTESDYQGKEVQGKIALIQRGTNSFSEKQRLAKLNGAVAAFIYNSIPNSAPMAMQLEDSAYLTIGLTKETGEELLDLIATSNEQLYSFDVSVYQFSNPAMGKLSTFSSWGLAPNLDFKPEIAAPGGQIYSTANQNGYQSMSGTSMAAPYVAGSEALLYQALKLDQRSSLTGVALTEFAKLTVMNTAQPVLELEKEGQIISPRRQGAGEILLGAALKNRTSLKDVADGDGALALKEIGAKTNFAVKLENHGTQPVSYRLKDYGGVYTEGRMAAQEVYAVQLAGASLVGDVAEISLEAGESQVVNFTLDLAESVAKQQFVEGYLGFESQDASQPDLTIPYVGFYGEYGADAVIDAPIYATGSIQGLGYFTDKNNALLGFKGGTIDSSAVAISPNQDGRKENAKPILYFLRNAKSVVYEVADSQGKVIRRLKESHQEQKDYFSNSAFTAHVVADASWDGKIYQQQTGKSEVVPEGQYQYKVTATANVAGATPQELYFPIKVDVTNPVVKNIGFSNNQELSLELTDTLSGVDLRAVVVSINGVIKTYNLSNQDSAVHTIPLDSQQQPAKGMNQVEVLVSDFAGNYGHSNGFVQLGTSTTEDLVLFNLKPGAVITTNTSNYSEQTQTLKINGAYPAVLLMAS